MFNVTRKPLPRMIGWSLFFFLLGDLVAGHTVFHGEIIKHGGNTLTVTLVLDYQEAFITGWMSTGDERTAKIYGTANGALRLIWQDGLEAAFWLEQYGDDPGDLFGILETKIEPKQVEYLYAWSGCEDPEQIESETKVRFMENLEHRIEMGFTAFFEDTNHSRRFNLFTALENMLPMTGSPSDISLMTVQGLNDPETAAQWYRNAASRAFIAGARGLLARHHQALTELWSRYPDKVIETSKYASALFPSDQEQYDVWIIKNRRIGGLHDRGAYREALSLARETYSFARMHFGFNHLYTLDSQTNLATTYQLMGNYERALPLFREALKHKEFVLGDHPDVFASRHNLAMLYASMGNWKKALLLQQKALERSIAVLGESHPHTLIYCGGLGALLESMGDYGEALPLYKKALDHSRQTMGEIHPYTVAHQNNLASLYGKMGNCEEAIFLQEDALKKRVQALGKNHPHTLVSQNNLAFLYTSTGQYDEALALYREVLAQSRQLLGESHPQTLGTRNNLAMTLVRADYPEEALDQFRTNLHYSNLFLERFSWGSARKFRLLMHDQESSFRPAYLSLLMDVGGTKAGEEMIQMSLNRDGMLRRIAYASNKLIRASAVPKTQELIEQLHTRRALFSTLVMKRPDDISIDQYKLTFADLESEMEGIEEQLRSQIYDYRPEFHQADVTALRERLGPKQALICFMTFPKWQYKDQDSKVKDRALIAVIVSPDTDSPCPIIRLGNLAPVAEEMNRWRRAVIQKSNLERIDKVGASLYKKLWEPLTVHLKSREELYIVADGPLQFLPIGALIGPDGTPLNKTVDFIFMESVFDLLTPTTKTDPGIPLICYAPDYGPKPQGTRSASSTNASELQQLVFPELQGARLEGETIANMFDMAGSTPRTLTGANATQTALVWELEFETPSVLHIASHGFFLEKRWEPKAEHFRGISLLSAPNTVPGKVRPSFNINHDDPLLRSGIALAGANLVPDNMEDDGLLTALEAQGLSLEGTRLVVLSACETGLGNVREGEGVYGLRRAFLLAGARALLITLWPVEDSATHRFMEGFYRYYLDGCSPRHALRKVQQEFQSREPDCHPIYWAPFHLIEIPEPDRRKESDR